MTNRTHSFPRTPALEERFWSKVDRSGGPEACWTWLSAKNSTNYGLFYISDSFGKMVAHRVAYVLCVGPIPDGLRLDHVCHSNDADCTLAINCPHRSCVNPAHLEPVTAKVNFNRGHETAADMHRAKTHCPQGHAYSEHGFQVGDGRPHRKCRPCVRNAVRTSMAKRRLHALTSEVR